MCGRWRAVVGKIFVVKLYLGKIFSYVFCVRKYFCNEKKKNYGMHDEQNSVLDVILNKAVQHCTAI